MSGVSELVRAFLRLDGVRDLANGAPVVLPGPDRGIAQAMLDLGECLLDRVQVRAARRQEEHVRTDRTDALRTSGHLWQARLSITTTSPGRGTEFRPDRIHGLDEINCRHCGWRLYFGQRIGNCQVDRRVLELPGPFCFFLP